MVDWKHYIDSPQQALHPCVGSLTEGDGWGWGSGYKYGYANSWGDGDGDGLGFGYGLGDGSGGAVVDFGDGRSENKW